MLFAAAPVLAQDYIWGGTGSTTTTSDYNLGSNWSTPGTPPPPVAAGQRAVFDAAGSQTVVVSGLVNPDSWTFNANSQSYSISGGAVGFSNGGIVNSANAGQTITISTAIGDNGAPASVQQLGASTLILSGANAYTGGTTISAGTLVAAHATSNSIDALGFFTSPVTMTGGTLQFAVDGSLANGITVSSGAATISAGAQNVGLAGAITLNPGATLQFAKAGDTGVLTLSGGGSTADATSAVVIAGGTVRDGGNAAITSLTFSAASTTVNVGATLDFDGSTNQAIRNLNGGGIVKTGAAGGNQLTLFVDGGTTSTFSGSITGSHPVEIETTIGSPGLGTMVFTGTNTYTGGTTICSCAALQLGDATHTASIVGDVTVLGELAVVNINGSGITSITNDGGLTTFFNGTSAAAIAITNESGGETDFVGNATAANATIVNRLGGLTTFNVFAGAGNASITNRFGGETDFYDGSTAGNATITNRYAGLTTFNGSSSAGAASITNRFGGQVFFHDNSTAGSATIVNGSNGNSFSAVPEGVFFTGNSTAGNATIINNNHGAIDFGFPGGTDTATAGNANITNNSGSTLQFGAFTTAGNATITTLSGGAVSFFDNSAGGNAQFITNGTGYVDFGQSIGPNSDGRITAGSIAGSGLYYIGGGNTLVVGSNNLSTTVSGVIADNNPCGCTHGPGSFEKVGSGTLTLSRVNTYSGTTTVNGGFLDVEGSIAFSSLTTVNAGGALTGAGTVGNTTIASGGIFLPGNGFGTSTTVHGNLAFQSGALYLVQINSTSSTFANVSGTANVNGNVGVAIDPSSAFIMKKYMILQAGGGVSGAFSGVSTPSNFVGSITYDPTHAYLNLDLNYGAHNSLNVNQQNVANTLSNFFNSNGGISAVLASLTPSGLSQTAGEIATGTQQATFNAMNMFMQLLSDPFVSGRGGGTATGGGAQPYAEEDSSLAYAARQSGSARDALARMSTKADVARNDLFDNRWSVWGSAFGGGANISGNDALGSNTADTRAFGLAAGADYRITPATTAGFALAGGGTNFSINSFGSGRSDLFQAGAFVRHNFGNAYVTAVAAYGGQDVWTDRTVAATGDHLQANFNTNAWSGRLEGGYRYVTPWMGITPYAAAQFTTLQLPAYAEQLVAGAGLAALSYNAQTVTDSRTELGLRGDKSYALQNGIFTLRGRLAWAHDFNTDRTAASAFQALPGTFFIVNGAAVAHDSALTTAAAEMKWMNGWSAALSFEGEFSDVYNSYAGKGVVRYTW